MYERLRRAHNPPSAKEPRPITAVDKTPALAIALQMDRREHDRMSKIWQQVMKRELDCGFATKEVLSVVQRRNSQIGL